MSIYLGDTLISGAEQFVGESRNIGQIIPSTIPLQDAGLHLLDGSLIQGSGIYSAFVDYIAGLLTDYPNLFCTEADWQTSVTNYGVCGKFVYDSVNNTVRLPKITGIIEGTTDVTALGDLVQAGLPNITGTYYSSRYKDFATGESGALYTPYNASYIMDNGSDLTLEMKVIGLDASRSSSLYRNNFNKVQPQTIKVLYYIVIATSTKTDIEVDIDEVITDLNSKSDTDLTNITNTASTKMAKASMPSDIRISLTIGAAGATYTAPADGWYVASGTSGYIYLTSYDSTGTIEKIHTMGQYGSGAVGHCYIPVKKNDTVTLWWQSSTMSAFYFIYAEGSKWENG